MVGASQGNSGKNRRGAKLNSFEFVSRASCELCGCESPIRLLSKPFTTPAVWDFIDHYYQHRVNRQVLEPTIYEIDRCPKCDFIWQGHILNGVGMAILYDQWISAENSFQKKQNSGEETGYRRQVEVIQAFMPQKPLADIRVLDFGMGWGYWCMAAKQAGYQVTGIEIADTRLEFTRKQGVHAVSSLDELGTETFDFINAEQVFEHIPNPLETLKQLTARLAPYGVIRIAVPDGKNIAHEVAQTDWKASKNAIHPLEHINCFTHNTLSFMGETAGLKVIPQPITWSLSNYGKPLFRSLATHFYRQFWGTVLYFQTR